MATAHQIFYPYLFTRPERKPNLSTYTHFLPLPISFKAYFHFVYISIVPQTRRGSIAQETGLVSTWTVGRGGGGVSVFVLVAQAKTHLVQPETYKHPHPQPLSFFKSYTCFFLFKILINVGGNYIYLSLQLYVCPVFVSMFFKKICIHFRRIYPVRCRL
jgi:hypothetical protein